MLCNTCFNSVYTAFLQQTHALRNVIDAQLGQIYPFIITITNNINSKKKEEQTQDGVYKAGRGLKEGKNFQGTFHHTNLILPKA